MDAHRLGVVGIRNCVVDVENSVTVRDEDGRLLGVGSRSVCRIEDSGVGDIESAGDVRRQPVVGRRIDPRLQTRLFQVVGQVELDVGLRVELDQSDVGAVLTDVESVDDDV